MADAIKPPAGGCLAYARDEKVVLLTPNPTMTMTPVQARQLAEALSQLADAADRNRG
jgi:hypothetical protein